MAILEAIFTALGTIASNFVTLLTSVFQSVANMIWTPGTGSDPGQLTVLGIFLLIGAGTGLVIFAFNFIRSLIRIRRG